MNMSIKEWFHIDEFHFFMDEFHIWAELNKNLDEIHPWLEDK